MDQKSSKQSQDKIAKARRMERSVNEFELEVKLEMEEIKEKIENVRGKVLSKINFDECL